MKPLLQAITEAAKAVRSSRRGSFQAILDASDAGVSALDALIGEPHVTARELAAGLRLYYEAGGDGARGASLEAAFRAVATRGTAELRVCLLQEFAASCLRHLVPAGGSGRAGVAGLQTSAAVLLAELLSKPSAETKSAAVR